MTRTTGRQQALAAAVRVSGFLADWMKEPDLATLEEVEPAFEALAGTVEALPPTAADAGLMCFLRNYLASSRRFYDVGEWGAAGNQLRHIHLKLGNLDAPGCGGGAARSPRRRGRR